MNVFTISALSPRQLHHDNPPLSPALHGSPIPQQKLLCSSLPKCHPQNRDISSKTHLDNGLLCPDVRHHPEIKAFHYPTSLPHSRTTLQKNTCSRGGSTERRCLIKLLYIPPALSLLAVSNSVAPRSSNTYLTVPPLLQSTLSSPLHLLPDMYLLPISTILLLPETSNPTTHSSHQTKLSGTKHTW